MTYLSHLSALALVAMLSACGGDAPDTGSDAPAMRNMAEIDAPQDTTQDPAPAFPGFGGASDDAAVSAGSKALACDPSAVRTSGWHIVGLAPGMSRADAVAAMACDESIIRTASYDYGFSGLDDLGFELDTGLAASDGQDCRPSEFPDFTDMSRNRSRGNAPLPCEPDPVFGSRAKNVTENIRLVTVGVPGEETVYGVFRTKTFAQGERADADGLAATLSQRFGTPARQTEQGNRLELFWQRGGNSTTGCRLASRAEAYEEFDSTCGTLATAVLERAPNSPLVQRMDTAIFDETGVMEALDQTQADLRRLRAAEDRRQQDNSRPASDVDL